MRAYPCCSHCDHPGAKGHPTSCLKHPCEEKASLWVRARHAWWVLTGVAPLPCTEKVTRLLSDFLRVPVKVNDEGHPANSTDLSRYVQGFLDAYRRPSATKKFTVGDCGPAGEEQVQGGFGDDLGRGVELGAVGAEVVPRLIQDGQNDVHAELPGLLDDIKPSDPKGAA